ncbi:hypothetical protein GF318_02265 [Candidatus Micrarchaeota archaeon]|nr:hypothetical protein [Candidatus Micrarchaeota archaeon]
MRPELQKLIDKHKSGKPKEEEKPARAKQPMEEDVFGKVTREERINPPSEARRSAEEEIASAERALDEAAAELEAEAGSEGPQEPAEDESGEADVSGMFRSIIQEESGSAPVVQGPGEDSLISALDDEDAAEERGTYVDEDTVSKIVAQVTARLETRIEEVARPLADGIIELKVRLFGDGTEDNPGELPATEQVLEMFQKELKATDGKADALQGEVGNLKKGVDTEQAVAPLKQEIDALKVKLFGDGTPTCQGELPATEQVLLAFQEELRATDDKAEALRTQVATPRLRETAEQATAPLRDKLEALNIKLFGDGTEDNPGELPATEQVLVAFQEEIQESAEQVNALQKELDSMKRTQRGMEEILLETAKRLLISNLREEDENARTAGVVRTAKTFGSDVISQMLTELVEDPKPILQELARISGTNLSALAKSRTRKAEDIKNAIEREAQLVVENAKTLANQDLEADG